MMKLSEVNRDNNLNIMRFIAAVLVIVSHSVPLCYGAKYSDFLSVWTDSRLSLGGLAVGVFFVSGGFLISKSAESKKTAKAFFSARCTRIFPQLMFVTFVVTFLIGPIITSLSLGTYYANYETYKYLLNGVLIPIHDLPGVFESNIYGATVNGPLWTLPIEFACYFMAFFAYKITKFNKKRVAVTIPIASIFVGASLFYFRGNIFILTVLRPVILFYIGILFYTYREYIVLKTRNLWISIALFVILVIMRIDLVAMILVFPFLIFNLAYGTKFKMSGFGTKYELSYGLYLWGWVCQQLLIQYCGNMSWYFNALIAFLLAILLGLANTIIIDKFAMPRLLKRIKGRK